MILAMPDRPKDISPLGALTSTAVCFQGCSASPRRWVSLPVLVGRLRIQADGYGRQEGDGRDGREEETRRDAGAKVWQRVLRSSRARPDGLDCQSFQGWLASLPCSVLRPARPHLPDGDSPPATMGIPSLPDQLKVKPPPVLVAAVDPAAAIGPAV